MISALRRSLEIQSLNNSGWTFRGSEMAAPEMQSEMRFSNASFQSLFMKALQMKIILTVRLSDLHTGGSEW